MLGNGSEVEAPEMGLNSSVGKGRAVLLAEGTACVPRVGKRQAEHGKAVGNGVRKPVGVKSRGDLRRQGVVSVPFSR